MFGLRRMGTLGVCGLLVAVPANAQQADNLPKWGFTTEFTFVWAAGNSQTSTWGLDLSATRTGVRSRFKLEAGGVRSQASLTTRTAVGTATAFTVNEKKVTEKTAEAFYARARYDYSFGDAVFGFGGVDWLRNQFSGIDSRFLVAGGAGNSWANNDRVKFSTDYSATYTLQQDVVENPLIKTNFPGARLAYDLWSQLTGSTVFTSVLIGDLNLDNTNDVRMDFTNALQISISSTLAFKPSHQLLWRNEPSLGAVDLFAPDGSPTGQKVNVPLQKLDSFFRLALVVQF